jgi:hypothetical protein
MKSSARFAKGSDNFSARIDLRVDPKFKKSFVIFCKDHRIKTSDAARKALDQYMILGEFKKHFFNYLHRYTDARKKFKEFYNSIPPVFIKGDNCEAVGNWFDDLLGSEEIKLINNTPSILLPSIKSIIITTVGEDALRERMKGK